VPKLRLVAFDLDDTLAPSKGQIDPRIAAQLRELLARVDVAIISGGNEAQFRDQVISQLQDATAEELSRLHLLPTCGTRYLRYNNGDFDQLYALNLEPEQRDAAFAALREEAQALGLWEAEPWGEILEDRGSQVTFSALGQQAPRDAKHAWDPDGKKREALRAAVAPRLPGLEVRSGGSTSIDITREGIDKAFGIQELAKNTGIQFDEMLFYGDRLDEGGNDYPVLELGVPAIAVTSWEDTAEQLDALLGALED
jgi:phosphomannomutase